METHAPLCLQMTACLFPQGPSYQHFIRPQKRCTKTTVTYTVKQRFHIMIVCHIAAPLACDINFFPELLIFLIDDRAAAVFAPLLPLPSFWRLLRRLHVHALHPVALPSRPLLSKDIERGLLSFSFRFPLLLAFSCPAFLSCLPLFSAVFCLFYFPLCSLAFFSCFPASFFFGSFSSSIYPASKTRILA